jgi:hypothetical protein
MQTDQIHDDNKLLQTAETEGEAEGPDFAAPAAAFPRPHFTPTLAPSMSTPEAHASAALSALSRSRKFMNAHLGERR